MFVYATFLLDLIIVGILFKFIKPSPVKLDFKNINIDMLFRIYTVAQFLFFVISPILAKFITRPSIHSINIIFILALRPPITYKII